MSTLASSRTSISRISIGKSLTYMRSVMGSTQPWHFARFKCSRWKLKPSSATSSASRTPTSASSATSSKAASSIRCSKTQCTALTCSTECLGSSIKSSMSYLTEARSWTKKSTTCSWARPRENRMLTSRPLTKCNSNRQQQTSGRLRLLTRLLGSPRYLKRLKP